MRCCRVVFVYKRFGPCYKTEVHFLSTNWAHLALAVKRDTPEGADAFSSLIERYRVPLIRVLVSHLSLSESEAEEHVQQFIVDKLMRANLLSKANQSRGKFRSLLVRSLLNFVIDAMRAQHHLPVQMASEQAPPFYKAMDAFEAEWAESVVADALAAAAQDLCGSGRSAYWELFHARYVVPAYDPASTTGYHTLIKRLGFDSPRAASNAIVTAKRTFARHLLRRLAMEAPAASDEGVAELLTVLAARRNSFPLSYSF